jgi:flagellar hook-basal body complex protein FliE
MNTPMIPKIQFNQQPMQLSTVAWNHQSSPMGSLDGHVSKMAFVEPAQQPKSFQNVMMNMLDTVNKTAQRPDALLKEAMTTGNVDIHDVMIANAQAELAVNVTAQMVTKAVQAYDRILQIQV